MFGLSAGAIAAIVVGVGSAVSSRESARSSANKAADAAAAGQTAATQATDIQAQQFAQQQANQAPWLATGKNALSQMAYGTGIEGPVAGYVGTGAKGDLSKPFTLADYEADPGYAFRLSEGVKALDRSASSKGQLLSGSALKGVTEYGQNMGSQEYQNAYNRYLSNQNQKFNQLASLADLGQTANNSLGQAGQNYANQASNIIMTNGANQGNAALAQGSINSSMYQGYNSALSSSMNALGKWAGSQNWGSTNSYSGDPNAADFVGPADPGTSTSGSWV